MLWNLISWEYQGHAKGTPPGDRGSKFGGNARATLGTNQTACFWREKWRHLVVVVRKGRETASAISVASVTPLTPKTDQSQRGILVNKNDKMAPGHLSVQTV